MTKQIDTLLLLALPASGKSEVRRYLGSVPADVCLTDFHMGPTTQLDDYPYVHFMLEVDKLVADVFRMKRIFFQDKDQPFRDLYEWWTLIELLNEDYADLLKGQAEVPKAAAMHLFRRIDRAARLAGAMPKLGKLPGDVQWMLADRLEAEARHILERKQAGIPESLAGQTLVIEFARGCPAGATFPLDPPIGYEHSIRRLDQRILADASILYVWVTPEQSRANNARRAVPPPGREKDVEMYHGVGMDVMLHDYFGDDMRGMVSAAGGDERHIIMEAHGGMFQMPVAFFDNRQDLTRFVQDNPDPASWPEAAKAALHAGLKSAMDSLAAAMG